jgi:hypothetical protein
MRQGTYLVKCIQRDALLLVGVWLVVLVLFVISGTNWWCSMMLAAIAPDRLRAALNGTTTLYLDHGNVSDAPIGEAKAAALVRWHGSRTSMGDPASPIVEEYSMQLDDIRLLGDVGRGTIEDYIKTTGITPGISPTASAGGTSPDGRLRPTGSVPVRVVHRSRLWLALRRLHPVW